MHQEIKKVSEKKDKKKKKHKERVNPPAAEGETSTQGSNNNKNDKKEAKPPSKKPKIVWLEPVGPKGPLKESAHNNVINPSTTQIVINLNKNQIERKSSDGGKSRKSSKR